MSFQEACEGKALRAKADALSSSSTSAPLHIGPKISHTDDKSTHEQQVNQIRKLTASLKL